MREIETHELDLVAGGADDGCCGNPPDAGFEWFKGRGIQPPLYEFTPPPAQPPPDEPSLPVSDAPAPVDPSGEELGYRG